MRKLAPCSCRGGSEDRDAVKSKAIEARKAALELANLPTEVKNAGLKAMAKAIVENQRIVLEANARDIEEAEKAVGRGDLTKAALQRLKLSEGKIRDIERMVKSVAKLEDPVGKTLLSMELDRGLELYKVSCPIGVIGVVFEARPDVLPQISALCLKSGNAVILKGGREAKNSNEALFKIIAEATEREGIPRGWIQLIEAREEVRRLLELDQYVDLLIPRGSKEFVRYVQENTKIPVLGHSEGICHIYVDRGADLAKAVDICFDAKVQYPAVCNAVETLLVHKDIATEFLPRIAEKYSEANVEMRGCEKTLQVLRDYEVKRATEEDWRTEYLDLIISIKVVDSLEEAVQHINTYGSKHTDAIITEDRRAGLKFLQEVDSSSVMLNASTRFSDGYRYGLGAEVGISTNKIHARGPTGLEGLVIYKYYVIGGGHVVADYVGSNAREFTHVKLQKRWGDVKRELEG